MKKGGSQYIKMNRLFYYSIYQLYTKTFTGTEITEQYDSAMSDSNIINIQYVIISIINLASLNDYFIPQIHQALYTHFSDVFYILLPMNKY